MKRYIRSAISDLSDEFFDDIYSIAEDANADPVWLKKISEIPNVHSQMLHAVASNPSTPSEVLDNIRDNITDTFWLSDIDWALAENPNTPKHIIKELYDRHDLEIERHLAANPNLDNSMLYGLCNASVRSPSVGAVLAKNPSVDAELLGRLLDLCYDSNDVKLSIMENPNVTTDILLRLAKDNRQYIRYELLKILDDELPNEVLSVLSNDSDKLVRGLAMSIIDKRR